MSNATSQLPAGDTLTVDIDSLKPHELNQDLYTNRDISELVEKIEEYGFQDEHRLIVTPDGKILSGHRRWRAAQEVGLGEIPVKVKAVDDELEALQTLLLANKYRQKTPAEVINEGEAWERIESERAQEREESGGMQEFAEGETGTTREKVGEKIGVSGETYRKGKSIKERAEEGDETAQEEWEKLESGEQSISGAYTEVRESEKKEDTYSIQEDEPKSGPEWKPVVAKNEQFEGYKDGSQVVIRVGGDTVEVSGEVFEALFYLKP